MAIISFDILILSFIVHRIFDILVDLFSERMECDVGYRYRPNSVNVYFENTLTADVHLIDVQQTIKQITSNKKYAIHLAMMVHLLIDSKFHFA